MFRLELPFWDVIIVIHLGYSCKSWATCGILSNSSRRVLGVVGDEELQECAQSSIDPDGVDSVSP